MASIPLSVSALDTLKKEVRRIYDERKSSHLTEALASALGFNTHAGLLPLGLRSGNDIKVDFFITFRLIYHF